MAKTILFRCDDELFARIAHAAIDQNVTRSHLIRESVTAYLAEPTHEVAAVQTQKPNRRRKDGKAKGK